jgi:hypothetical protein
MLRKLMKYEFKATARYFIPLIIALLAVAVVNRFCFAYDKNLDWLPTNLAIVLYVGIIIAICVLALIITIKRFYNSLLTDEGYLMMTLPASVDSHIWSKTITAGFWVIVSTLITGCSVLVMISSGDFWHSLYTSTVQIYQTAVSVIGFHFWIFIGLWFLVLLFNLASQLMTIYMCISIGHQIPKHQLLGGIGAYLVVMIIVQTLMTVFVYFGDSINIQSWFEQLQNVPAAYFVTLAFLLINVVMLAVTYLVTRYLLKNRLNLE